MISLLVVGRTNVVVMMACEVVWRAIHSVDVEACCVVLPPGHKQQAGITRVFLLQHHCL